MDSELLNKVSEICETVDTVEVCNNLGLSMELFDVKENNYTASINNNESTSIFSSSEPVVNYIPIKYTSNITLQSLIDCGDYLPSDIGIAFGHYMRRASRRTFCYTDIEGVDCVSPRIKFKNKFKLYLCNTVLMAMSDKGEIILANIHSSNLDIKMFDVDTYTTIDCNNLVLLIYKYCSSRFEYGVKLHTIGLSNYYVAGLETELNEFCTNNREIRIRRDVNRYTIKYNECSLDNLKDVGVNNLTRRKEHWNK